MPEVKKECTCSFAQRLQGDGCEACNLEKAIEILREKLAESEQRVKAMEDALKEIAWSDECASLVAKEALEATCQK